jgi:hypothetical protein
MRRVRVCPSHFFCTTKQLKLKSVSDILDWIYEHTQGRFYIKEHPAPESMFIFGFESQNDLLMFELCFKEEW